jgi:hypothetical protein
MEVFKKHFPNKKIFYRGQITKTALEYYLEICDAEELRSVQQFRLPEKLQPIYAKKLAEGVVEVIEEDPSLVKGYIDKNEEIMQKLRNNQKIIGNLNENIIQYSKYIEFLYNINGKMLALIKSEKLPFPITEEEIETITEIKEVIE